MYQSKRRHAMMFPRQNRRSPLQARDFSTIAMPTPSHTSIVVDLPATNANQSLILTPKISRASQTCGGGGGSPHPTHHDTEATTLK